MADVISIVLIALGSLIFGATVGYALAVARTAHLIARMTADEQRALFDRAARLRR